MKIERYHLKAEDWVLIIAFIIVIIALIYAVYVSFPVPTNYTINPKKFVWTGRIR